MSQTESEHNDRWSQRVDRLLEAALALSSELDTEAVLQRIVEGAASVAGARYAAIGIYDSSGTITNFVHHGIDEATARAIGDLPHGRGMLGEVIVANGPIRLDDLGNDPRSVGFPPNHPPMHRFLGVPITRGGRRYGNLYLTEKSEDRAFDSDDEAFVTALAAFAAGAIESAQLAATRSEIAALEARDRTRHEMLGEVINAQEAERARVSRDLHDDVGQALTSVLLGLRLVEGSLKTPKPDIDDAHSKIEEVRSLVADALQRARRLAFDLRPTVLDDIGLDAALTRLVDDTTERGGVAVDLAVNGIDDRSRLPVKTETVIYRVVQEALTNVMRHAQASSVSVVVHRGDGRIRAVIEDNGVGFDAKTAGSASLGLRGMSERAVLNGGNVDIHSAPGAGTTVVLEVPDE